MWETLPDCFRRHKKKILFLGGVVGAIAFFNSYLKKKLVEWETQRTTEICDQLKRSSHFETTMQNCDGLFIKFSAKIRSIITKTVDVNMVVEKASKNPPNKIQLWEELKILVFTQTLGEMYAQCLLCVLLKVQMSILSGYIFANRFTNSYSMEKQTKYLSGIESFLLNGVHKLLGQVRKVVEEHLKDVPLQSLLKLRDIELKMNDIQGSMLLDNSHFFQDITCYLMPPSSSNVEMNEFLNNIFIETRDVIECQDFLTVFQSCTECGVSSIMDRFSECYVILSDKNGDFSNPHDFSAPLPKLIPLIHNVFSQHLPSEQGSLPHTLLQITNVNKFAANIYEAFSHDTS